MLTLALLQVRCTGERTGCLRCQNLDQSCIYVESRVGKVQGRRSRIKRGLPRSSTHLSALPSSLQQQNLQPASTLPQPTIAATQTENQLSSPVSLLWTENDDTYMNWSTLDIGPVDELQHNQLDFKSQTNDFFADDAIVKAPSYDFGPGMTTACLATPDTDIDKTFSLPSFHDISTPEIDTLISPSLSWPTKPSPSPTNPPLSLSPQTYPHLNLHHQLPSPCSPNPDREKTYLLNSLRAIDHLERNVLAHLSALDEILSLNRRTLAEIDAFSAESSLHTTSCLVVSAVLLHLVVGLFESGCTIFEKDSSGSCGAAQDGRGCEEGSGAGFTLPRLGMGGFTLDAEEQLIWGRRVVAKELRRCDGVVQRVGEVMVGDGKAVYDACFRDLEPRLKALISLVEA